MVFWTSFNALPKNEPKMSQNGSQFTKYSHPNGLAMPSKYLHLIPLVKYPQNDYSLSLYIFMKPPKC